jgi:hypothetical protein
VNARLAAGGAAVMYAVTWNPVGQVATKAAHFARWTFSPSLITSLPEGEWSCRCSMTLSKSIAVMGFLLSAYSTTPTGLMTSRGSGSSDVPRINPRTRPRFLEKTRQAGGCSRLVPGPGQRADRACQAPAVSNSRQPRSRIP